MVSRKGAKAQRENIEDRASFSLCAFAPLREAFT